MSTNDKLAEAVKEGCLAYYEHGGDVIVYPERIKAAILVADAVLHPAAPAPAVEAPTGAPLRAWTEQERQDAQDAMRKIVDSEKQAPAVGGDVDWIKFADELDAFRPQGELGQMHAAGMAFAYADVANAIRFKISRHPPATQGGVKEVLTYKNQPGNVEAWRLGEACRHAQPGGDPIDHGLSLLQKLQEKGFGVVRLAAIAAQAGVSDV